MPFFWQNVNLLRNNLYIFPLAFFVIYYKIVYVGLFFEKERRICLRIALDLTT